MEDTNTLTPQGGKTSLGTSPITEAENKQTAALVRDLRAAGNDPLEIRRALVANYPEPHSSKLRATFASLNLAV